MIERYLKQIEAAPAGVTWNDGNRAASASFRTNHPDYPKITLPVQLVGPPPAASGTH